MKSKSSGKDDNGLRRAEGWIAVKVCPRSEEAIFGTFRATRRGAREELSLLLCAEVRRDTGDLASFVAKKVEVAAQVWAGTYDDIRVGCRRFRIAYARGTWWPS